MNKKRFSALRLILIVLVIVLLAGIGVTGERTLREPVEVRTLRKQQVTQSDEGHQEYYFGLLTRMSREAIARFWRVSGVLKRSFTCLFPEMTR